jgi:hypothetical protein
VGGLALFVLLGVVVAIVSLARPETESFDSRARILFRRQTGRHIDYIIGRIPQLLEHYTESNVVTVTLQEYHAPSKRYRVAVEYKTCARAYIDDIDSTYKDNIDYSGVTSPPEGGARNSLVFLRVNEKVIARAKEFDTDIKHPVETAVRKNGICTVEIRSELWVNADDEPNTHSCSRYSQQFELYFMNNLTMQVRIKMLRTEVADAEISLDAGDRKLALQLKDVAPGVDVCDFRILSP